MAPFYRWGNNRAVGGWGRGALPELERHPAWVYRHLDPRCSLPLSHALPLSLIFTHVSSHTHNTKTLHNTQGFYTPMHTGTFSHSCIHHHSHTCSHVRSHSPVLSYTHASSYMHLTHTHSYSCSLISLLSHSHTQPTRTFSQFTPTLSHTCILGNMYVHVLPHAHTCPHPHESAHSPHTHSCTRVLGSPPRAKFTPHLPQCPCCAVTVALECWWLNSGG